MSTKSKRKKMKGGIKKNPIKKWSQKKIRRMRTKFDKLKNWRMMKLKKIKILKLIIVNQIGIKKEGSNPKKKKT